MYKSTTTLVAFFGMSGWVVEGLPLLLLCLLEKARVFACGGGVWRPCGRASSSFGWSFLRRLSGCVSPRVAAVVFVASRFHPKIATWLILPVVIRSSQRLSHA